MVAIAPWWISRCLIEAAIYHFPPDRRLTHLFLQCLSTHMVLFGYRLA